MFRFRNAPDLIGFMLRRGVHYGCRIHLRRYRTGWPPAGGSLPGDLRLGWRFILLMAAWPRSLRVCVLGRRCRDLLSVSPVADWNEPNSSMNIGFAAVFQHLICSRLYDALTDTQSPARGRSLASVGP